jgi:hypothetical protein
VLGYASYVNGGPVFETASRGFRDFMPCASLLQSGNTGAERQDLAYTAEACTRREHHHMATTGLHQQPTPERFFNAINAYGQTEAMTV